MSKKCKVNWSDIDGASPKPKRLHLEKDETDSLYHCPIQECDHDGFQSQRGCRKHVNTKHSWFFYFDEKPNSKEIKDSLMIAAAKEKGGFIDQKAFKTAGKYGFDSLILTDANMQVLNGYISYVRPLLKPWCDFVLVNRNGDQHGKLGEIMSKLVFDAIGKYIHPTRQIVETQSLNQLSSEEQRILSEDQKHSSAVAKVHYQKQ